MDHQKIERYLEEHAERQLAELKQWLSIPSISTLERHRGDVRRAATWLADRVARAGLHNTELIEGDGHPLVYADWLGAGPDHPTVLLYGHYDVQPVEPLAAWTSPPFEPTERRGVDGAANLYARGATDDKGQLLAQLFAVEALLAVTGALPVNLRLIAEGEEEAGSGVISTFVQANPERLAADVCLISDTSMLAPEIPSIDYGLRGMWAGELVVRGPRSDLHSGGFGGVVLNPAQALAELIATFHDAEGRVAVEGFYDEVREPSPDERRQLELIPFGEQEVLAATGVPALYGEPGYSVVERIGARPTLEINGIWGGHVGEGFKTVIPAAAHAKLSCRLVPDQDPAEIDRLLQAHCRRAAPAGADVELRQLFALRATLIDPELRQMRAAAAALERAFGAAPLFTLGGGGIPVVPLFQELLELPVVLMGFGLPDDGAHAPDEKIRLQNFYRGIRAGIYFLQESAEAAEQ